MPTFRINVSTQIKADILNASKTQAAGRRMVVEINDAIAIEGVHRVKARLGQVLQNPTGYYESNISVDRRTTYRGVTDSGVVYGGWLEGVSSRNATSRFKGYRTFRIVKQGLAQDKNQIAEPIVRKFIQEMSN